MLTGAGCSYSAGIPLANQLTQEINKKYKAECAELPPNLRQDYGACMSILPTNEYKALFKPYLDNAKINWGHLAIATMMEAGFIGRVLTFNFDPILAKACGLLGIYPATYDFVSGVSSNTSFIAQTAILHLHGQGHSLAMLNSTEETKNHAKNLEPLLRDILAHHPIMVIGYSGQSDAVFKVIQNVYTGAERLDWIGHKENSQPHINTLLAKRSGVTKYVGGADSDEFLMDVARELGCWPPKLFKNAYDHLLDELEFVGKYPDSNEDLLEDLKAELESLRDEKTKNPDQKFTAFLDKDWDALEGLVEDTKESPRDKELLAFAKFNQAYKLQTKENPTQSDFESAAELYKQVTILKPDDYDSYNNWGNALKQLAELTNDNKNFKESLKKYEKAVELNPNFYQAYSNWGIALIRAFTQTKDKAYLTKARDILKIAQTLNPDDLYDFACLHTLSGKIDEAKKALLHCEKKGTLPKGGKQHLETDPDLDPLRELDWFKDLLSRLD